MCFALKYEVKHHKTLVLGVLPTVTTLHGNCCYLCVLFSALRERVPHSHFCLDGYRV